MDVYLGMIQELAIASLFITGLYTLCSHEGVSKSDEAWANHYDSELPVPSKMPLWFLSHYSKKLIGEFWSKPLFTCNVCMSSFWGTVFYIVIVQKAQTDIAWITINWIIFIIALTGINRIIHEKYLG